MNSYLDRLSQQFNSHLSFREKRPGVTQLFVPLFHGDGDMVEIYLEASTKGERFVRVTDAGATLMRLSYDYDINTETKDRIFRQILAECQIHEERGEIFLDAPLVDLYPSILQFSQGVSKVLAMRHFKREAVAGMFYEMVGEFIERELVRFGPEDKVLPLPDRDDLMVDYAFTRLRHPVFLFAVKGADKAHVATISCLEFQRAGIPHHSVIVHEDMEALSKKDRNRLTSAVDKQFVSLADFRAKGPAFLEREAIAG